MKENWKFTRSYFDVKWCKGLNICLNNEDKYVPENYHTFINYQVKNVAKFMVVLLFSLWSTRSVSQTEGIVNPKGKWFFGVEAGLNTIKSYELDDPDKSLQGGFLAEYYFAKNWSISGRLKYFKTGVSFFKGRTGGIFSSPEYSGTFNGAVLSIPINFKWEFNIYKNLRLNMKLGYALNKEIKSEYLNYSENQETDYHKHYGSFNAGMGFNYFLSKQMAIFCDLESYVGSSRGEIPGFVFGNEAKLLENILLNIGIKYTFKQKD